MPAKQTQHVVTLKKKNCDSGKLIHYLSTVKLTAESWRRELKRSFQVTAALRKASWRRMSCSTSSVWAWATPPSWCLVVISGSLAFSQASAFTVSWANWNFSCSGSDRRPATLLPTHYMLNAYSVESVIYMFVYVLWGNFIIYVTAWISVFLVKLCWEWICNVSSTRKEQ